MCYSNSRNKSKYNWEFLRTCLLGAWTHNNKVAVTQVCQHILEKQKACDRIGSSALVAKIFFGELRIFSPVKISYCSCWAQQLSCSSFLSSLQFSVAIAANHPWTKCEASGWTSKNKKGGDIGSLWNPEWLCVVDTGTAMSRTVGNCLRLIENW